MLLRCFDTGEANRLMAEVHSGDCGAHMNGFMLSRKILRMGYYWFTMEHDCAKYVRACQQCQFYADKSKAPSVPLNNMTTFLHQILKLKYWVFNGQTGYEESTSTKGACRVREQPRVNAISMKCMGVRVSIYLRQRTRRDTRHSQTVPLAPKSPCIGTRGVHQ